MMNKSRVPCIFSDIDGVITHDKKLIPRVKEATDFLRKPLARTQNGEQHQNGEKARIPLLFLTNKGRITEEQLANQMNTLYGYKSEEQQFVKDDFVLSHSAIKDIVKSFEDRLILIVGVENIDHVLEEEGVNVPYITTYEYATLFRELLPFSARSEDEILEVREKLKIRLQLKDQDFQEPFQIHAIFIFLMPTNWEESMQITMDVLSTSNGKITQDQLPEEGLDQHIPIYTMNQDFFHQTKFRIPRLANGSFIFCLKALYKEIYKKELKTIMYGKPSKLQFEFSELQVKKYIKQNEDLEGITLTNFYMIGDNPHSDIRGANTKGWISILVRTGVFKGEGNDPIDPATYVVNDFYQAIELICKLESIQFVIDSNL